MNKAEREIKVPHRFEYIELDDIKNIESKLNFDILSLECKHVLLDKMTEKQERIKRASENIGYYGVVWGLASGGTTTEYEVDYLRKMQKNRSYNRAIRIVRTSDGTVWADNTHTTIAYYLRNRLMYETVYLNYIPFYIVDFYNSNIPVIMSYNNSVIKNIDDILIALQGAYNIEARVIHGINRSLEHWTIGEFIDVIDILK